MWLGMMVVVVIVVDLKQQSTMRLGSVGTNLMASERASRCVGVAWTVVKSFTLVVVAPEALTG